MKKVATASKRRLLLARPAVLAFALAMLGVAGGLWAQGEEGAAPAAEQAPAGLDLPTGELPTVLNLFFFSPWINGVILTLSVIALMLFLFFLLTVTHRSMAPGDLLDEVNKLVLRQKYEAAADLCRAHRRVFVASILQRAVENAGRAHSVILDMIDSEGRRRADVTWNRISYLADISNVAPMLGLLGTVLGMIKAFFVLPHQEATALSTALAAGVGQAMATTMFGLIVGILALVFYSIVKARVTRVLADAEQAVHSVADRIARDAIELEQETSA